jgi:hypothetical protein
MRRMTSLAVFLALFAGACSGSDTGGGERAELRPLGGAVEVLRGGDPLSLEESVTLEMGDVVSTSDGGRALIELPGEQTMELAPNSQIRMAGGPAPHLVSGRALVRATDGLTLNVGPDTVEARDSVFRVTRDYATVVGVYRGSVTVVDTAMEVPTFRELTVVAGDTVPFGSRPLLVRPSDPWDVRMFGAAIDVGIGIQRLERGLAAQLRGDRGRQAAGQALERRFAPAQVNRMLRETQSAELAELVVAGELAAKAAQASGSNPAGALEGILGLRDEGAQWIVIVAQWQLARTSLLEVLSSISGLIARSLGPEAGTVTPGVDAGGPTGSPGDLPGPPSTNPPPGDGGQPPGGGGDPPDDPPDPPDEPECDDTVECVVEDLIDGVSGL